MVPRDVQVFDRQVMDVTSVLRRSKPALLPDVSVAEYISGTERAELMRWFQKERQPDIWEVADIQPLGDIEAAQRIREICAAAGAIATTRPSRRPAETDKAADAERCQAAIKRALEIAMKISDDAMRDIAVSQIIGLCVTLDHMKTARILLRAIRSPGTQTELVAEHPALREGGG